MAKDDFKILKNGKILDNKKKVVADMKQLKKGNTPVVLHKGERIIQTKKDINKVKKLEKKYNISLFPKK
tara:strand:+ start:261 stop:467 length:207 start_codon:yes stop_codon:yes gene_type:complete